MKKLLLSIVFSVFYVTSASADLGVNVGVSGNAGLFAASANESFSDTVSGANTNQNGTEHGSAGWASIFIEKSIGDVLLVGIDYVPEALETDTTETAKSDQQTSTTDAVTAVTNKIQIDFENLTTMYIGARLGESFYAKAGVMTVDVITNETLNTGGAYPDTDLSGYTLALGYNRDLDNDMFVRLEASYMELDGATVTNTNDSLKSVTADGITGYGARVSIGKSF